MISDAFVPWALSRLADEIFIDLMKNDNYNKDEVQNKYVDEFENKFNLSLGSSKTYFEISFKDLNEETIDYLKHHTEYCRTKEEQYQKIDGIIPDVIAEIAKQTEHRFLANIKGEDPILLTMTLCNIREFASNHWRFIQ